MPLTGRRRVVPAGIEDAELVHRIMCEAYREYGEMEPPMSGADETVAEVATAMARGGAVLAWDHATPIGSARYRLSREFVRIKRVSVLPLWRGRGIATAMLDYIERHALSQGRTQARLSARMSLVHNVNLYRRAGYEVVNLKAHPRGDDVVGVFVKELSEDRLDARALG